MVANPQRENGHVDLAHEIVEKFCEYRLSGLEWQILWVIFRKTYGWQKVKDKIALSQFKQMTNLPRSTACRVLSKLVTKGVIKKDNTIPTTYSFVKDYDKWKVLPKKVTYKRVLPKKVIGVTKSSNTSVTKEANQVLPKKRHTNTIITKETITNTTITKETYGEHVLLTKEEYRKLTEKLGQYDTDRYVEKLDNYIGSKGKRYHSHYRTILVWADKDKGDLRPWPTQAQVNTLASMAKLNERIKNEETSV